MVCKLVGSVEALWRYPAKSMVGRGLKDSEVTTLSLLGDRAYALLDVNSGKTASVKNPKEWTKLLNFRAEFINPPHRHESIPPVNSILIDRNSITNETSDANNILSTSLEQTIKILSSAPETANPDQYQPPVEGTTYRNIFTR